MVGAGALVAGLLGEDIVGVRDQAGLGHGPLVRGEEQDVRAGGVHLVRLARVDGLLLHRLDLQRVQLLVEHLAPARAALATEPLLVTAQHTFIPRSQHPRKQRVRPNEMCGMHAATQDAC